VGQVSNREVVNTVLHLVSTVGLPKYRTEIVFAAAVNEFYKVFR